MIVYIGLQILYVYIVDIFVLWHCSKGPIDPVPPAHALIKAARAGKTIRAKEMRRRGMHCELLTLTYFWKLVCNSINDNYNNKLLHNQHRRCHLPVEKWMEECGRWKFKCLFYPSSAPPTFV